MMFRRVAPAAIVAAALALAPAAMANTTATGYGPPGNDQQNHVTQPKVLGVSGTGNNTTPPSAAPQTVDASTSSSLPFTGFDLILVLATGTALVAAGFGLRRLTRRESAI
jgi:hypothetical protein